MRTSSHTPPSIVTEAAAFIGIDYHKKYSVWHAIAAAGCDLGKGRIEHLPISNSCPCGSTVSVNRSPIAPALDFERRVMR